MIRHFSKSNKLRNVNPERGRTGNITIQGRKIYLNVKIKVIALIMILDETNSFKWTNLNPKMVFRYQTLLLCLTEAQVGKFNPPCLQSNGPFEARNL